MQILLPYLYKNCNPKNIILNLDITPNFAMYNVLKAGNINFWEKEVLTALLTLISTSDNPRFLDIGANIGFYSLVAGLLFADNITIVGVEPTPKLASIFEYLAKINTIELKILNIALFSNEQKMKFYIQNDDSCSSLIRGKTFKEEILIQTKRLDSIYDSFNIIKIDTEGTEYDVLQSGINSIRQHRPFILIEILNKNRFEKLYQFFKKLDYNFYILKKNFSLKIIQEYPEDQMPSEYNFLLSPEILSQNFLNTHSLWSKAIVHTFNFFYKDFCFNFNDSIKLRKTLLTSYDLFLKTLINLPNTIKTDEKKYNFAYYPLSDDNLLHYEYLFNNNRIELALHFEGPWEKHIVIIDEIIEQSRYSLPLIKNNGKYKGCHFIIENLNDIIYIAKTMKYLIEVSLPILKQHNLVSDSLYLKYLTANITNNNL